MERKLAAILSADVKSYSRLMGEDEAATIRPERRPGTGLFQRRHDRGAHHRSLQLRLAYHVAGRYEEAIAAAKRALARNPNLSFACDTHDLFAWSYSELGREQEARAAVGELLKLFPYWSLEIITLKSPYKDPTITGRRVVPLHKAGVPWRWPTANREALDHVGSGLEYLLHYTTEGNVQARRSFEQAFALDPQYAAAYAFMGWTYWQEWVWQWSEDPQSLERALDLTQQAIALDASLPLVHRVLGHVNLWKKQQPYGRGECGTEIRRQAASAACPPEGG